MMQRHRSHSPFRRWMDLLIDCNNHGGRITVGPDAGDIHTLYGCADLQEPNLLQQADFGPLEVLRADLVVVEKNPLADWSCSTAPGPYA